MKWIEMAFGLKESIQILLLFVIFAVLFRWGGDILALVKSIFLGRLTPPAPPPPAPAPEQRVEPPVHVCTKEEILEDILNRVSRIEVSNEKESQQNAEFRKEIKDQITRVHSRIDDVIKILLEGKVRNDKMG